MLESHLAVVHKVVRMDSAKDNNSNFYKNKIVLVTGGAGSIGSGLVKTLLTRNPKTVRILDNNETALFDLDQQLQSRQIRTFIGDVRDYKRLKKACENVDIVFHAAALKHVPLCEYNPFEAVQTNVLSTQHVIEAALDQEVRKVIFISTDKAVNPNCVMGATKLLAERLMISANYYRGSKKTIFSCVRFGNVLNTRGSVAPIFARQIKRGGPVTVTDSGMTRFVMSIPKAVGLILKAGEIAQGGETFLLKMQALRIIDLAEAMIEELAPKYGYRPDEIEMVFTGKRSKEKLHEELITNDEAEYVLDSGEFFTCWTSDTGAANKVADPRSYTSKEAKKMSKSEIKDLLRTLSL